VCVVYVGGDLGTYIPGNIRMLWGPGDPGTRKYRGRGQGGTREKKRKEDYIPSYPSLTTSTPYNTKLMYLKPEKSPTKSLNHVPRPQFNELRPINLWSVFLGARSITPIPSFFPYDIRCRSYSHPRTALLTVF
jgi:hypothetical protein